MSLRVKLLVMFTLSVVVAITVMDWGVERYARAQFQEVDQQRSGALVAQFQQELQQRGEEVVSGVQGIADAESTTRMVLDLSRPQSDASIYANDARGLADAHQLDYLELASGDGTLISVAQWPQQIGYKNDWVTREADWSRQGAFFDRVEMPESVELGLLAVRMVHVGDQNFYIIGGRRMDRDFLQVLALPAGMRALLYRNLENGFVPAALSSTEGPVAEPERFAPLIESLQKTAHFSQQAAPEQGALEQSIQWTSDPASTEKFATVPLAGRRGELLGALLLGSSQGGLVSLLNYVRGLALVIGTGALLLGFLMSWWISARVSQPLLRLAGGIDEVAGGDWEVQVEAPPGGEIGQLLRSFNRMAGRITDERTRILTVERVAAWREMAQQLAGEIYAGIMPLQKAVEKLGQGHEENPEQFDEIVAESLATLRLELRILQATGEGLMDFARSPEVHSEALRINDIVTAAVKSFEPQFCSIGRPPITPELYLDEEVIPLRGDPVRLRKAIESLLYCALVDMPAGGTLTIRTKQQGRMAHLVISDTGRGFEIENPARMFSMRPASGMARGAGQGQAIGEGLILATVQAIVSDHGGRMSMESAPGAGTTFFVDLPAVSEMASRRRIKSKTAAAKPKPHEIEAAPAVIADSIPETAPDSPSEVIPELGLEAAPDVSTNDAPEAVSEGTMESLSEEISEAALEAVPECESEASAESSVEAAQEAASGQMDFESARAGETEAPLDMPPEVKPEREMTEMEVAWQMLETMQIEGPLEDSEQSAAARQPQFLSDAPEPHPWAADGWSALEEIPAAPVETLDDVEVKEQSEIKSQSPDTSLLNALEEMLEAGPEAPTAAAPEATLEPALEEIPRQTGQQGPAKSEVWRSPLTYR